MKLKKMILSFALIGCFAAVSPLQALAATSTEIQEQIDSYMADLEASQQKSEELEEMISYRQEEVGELYAQVASLNIEKDSYYQEMKKRIAYFYEERQGYSLLEYLLSSNNFAEFISRIQIQQALINYDTERMEEYQDLVNDVEAKQADLDTQIEELGDMVEEQVILQATLDATISDKEEELAEVKAEEEAAAKAAAEAAAKKAAEEAAAKEAARRASMDAAVYAIAPTSVTAETTSSGTASSSSASETTAAASASTETVSDTSGTSSSASSEASSSSSSSTASETSSSSSSSTASETSASSETYSSSSSSSETDYDMPGTSGVLTKDKGVNYYNGHMETWYTQRILPGEALNIPGRHLDSRGIVCDGDGYICVASNDYPKGTIVETSLGTAKVYDSGCASGIIDIYTDW